MKVSGLYKIECYIFKGINRYFDQKTLNIFFSNITHIGGATFSIALTLFFLIFAKGTLHQAAIATAISLAISHIPVQIKHFGGYDENVILQGSKCFGDRFHLLILFFPPQ